MRKILNQCIIISTMIQMDNRKVLKTLNGNAIFTHNVHQIKSLSTLTFEYEFDKNRT